MAASIFLRFIYTRRTKISRGRDGQTDIQTGMYVYVSALYASRAAWLPQVSSSIGNNCSAERTLKKIKLDLLWREGSGAETGSY